MFGMLKKIITTVDKVRPDTGLYQNNILTTEAVLSALKTSIHPSFEGKPILDDFVKAIIIAQAFLIASETELDTAFIINGLVMRARAALLTGDSNALQNLTQALIKRYQYYEY